MIRALKHSDLNAMEARTIEESLSKSITKLEESLNVALRVNENA